MEERGVSRPREKLPRCRSLQDNTEEAEMVWDVIAKRYPNAAPLLREMETAIERAEELLHRLRSAPYYSGKEIGTKCSKCLMIMNWAEIKLSFLPFPISSIALELS